MGCKCAKQNIKIISNLKDNKLNIKKSLRNKENYFKNINENNLFRIFNFLNFKDLQEIGKVNYTFMKTSCNPDLLIKFFENKKFTKSNESTKIGNEKIFKKIVTFQDIEIKN
jgi:hypothetical protein